MILILRDDEATNSVCGSHCMSNSANGESADTNALHVFVSVTHLTSQGSLAILGMCDSSEA